MYASMPGTEARLLFPLTDGNEVDAAPPVVAAAREGRQGLYRRHRLRGHNIKDTGGCLDVGLRACAYVVRVNERDG